MFWTGLKCEIKATISSNISSQTHERGSAHELFSPTAALTDIP